MNTLTKGNTNLITVNQVGNGLKFDGADDFVTIPYSPILDFEYTDDWSASVWLKPISNDNSGADRGLNRSVSNDYTGIDLDWQLYLGNLYVSIMIWENGTTLVKLIRFIDSDITSLRNYVFVKSGLNANNYRIYKNGILLNTSVLVNNNFTTSIKSNKPYFINRSSGTFDNYLNNEIYDLKIFNKALNQAEVTQLYDFCGNNLAGLEANILANYNFNQKQGNLLTDNSVNQNHGTLTNFGATSNLGGGAWLNSLGNPITY